MSGILKFPPGFLWGSAVSSYQVEGGINNCDWSRDFPAGRACDYYNQYEKYFDLAKKLGQNIHRLSLEWSRIEPEEGKFDREAIGHYKKMLLALRMRGIKSMVTIWHWTNPVWFAAKGGWENPKAPEYFRRFVKAIASELDSLVDFWITLNEPMVHLSMAYILGKYPPYQKNILKYFKVNKNFWEAHKSAYTAIHDFSDKAKVGISYNATYVSPKHEKSIIENAAVAVWHHLRNHAFLDSVKTHLDYLGLNYYFHDTLEFTPLKYPFITINNKNASDKSVSDMEWQIFPEGIYHTLKDLARYKVPICITENGIADARDKKRGKFIIDHLKFVHKAISEGIDVKGYLHWSLVDNFEWTYGFSQKFGLVEFNPETMETKIRPSALKYAEICKNNRIKN